MNILIIVSAVLSVLAAIYAFYRILRKTEAQCGHKTRFRGVIRAFDERRKITFKTDNPQFCLDCLEEMTIKCAWCDNPIFVGDPITLYSPRSDDFEVPEHAVVYKKNPLTLVGCGRRTCADTGADYAGFWTHPGEVERHPTAFDRILHQAQ